jgi:hypothetical protein
MSDPRSIEFSTDPVSHDPGVFDRETDVDGVRWALVEYPAGAGRAAERYSASPSGDVSSSLTRARNWAPSAP